MKKYFLILGLLVSLLSNAQYAPVLHMFAEIKVDGALIQGEVTTSHDGTDFTDYVDLKAANIDLGKVLVNNGQVGPNILRPLVIKKRIDRASIPLVDAFTNNKEVEMTIHFISIEPNTGLDKERFIYTIDNARILSFGQSELYNPQTGRTEIVETLRLTYQTLEMEDVEHSTITIIDNSTALP